MFKVEKDNQKVGRYLGELIDQKYKSKREFCRAYIRAAGETLTDETINNMANRLAQIVKGKKAIQTYDLPYFTKLLGISCEQILSAGECAVPIADRVTNYAIACSKDPAEWEAYIHRPDKLILNCDEYCKTVLDYALEFGNYDFIKFLMDKKYIWFDGRNDKDYVFTFGAGTSIERRRFDYLDYGLEGQMKEEDALRLRLIALAADREDLEMLNELRARENPQLYYSCHYLSRAHPDFDGCYDPRMVRYIAASGERVLDYFTEPFNIRDSTRYRDGSQRVHTFMFPYISQLLDQLIITDSPFAETALKKAIKHNKRTYQKLHKLCLDVKNDERYSVWYLKDEWIKVCREELEFYENGNIVSFRAILSGHRYDGLITNVAHVTKKPATPILEQLVLELEESYLAIKNLKDNLEEL